MTQPILVTGAAGGNQGATGRRVAELLLERGFPVRGFVRKPDARADALRELGAEVVAGDLFDPASVQAAMKGVKRAYFTYPVTDGLTDATAIFASAARDAGVELVVNNSQFKSTANAPTFRNLQHRLGEQIFDWAQVGAVHLQGPPYYEGVTSLISRTVVDQDTVFMPWGDGHAIIPLVGAEDVSRIAASLLADARPPSQRTYFPVSETPTVSQIVHTLERALGRRVRYVAITDEQWVDAVQGRINDAHIVDHLLHLWAYFRTTTDEFRVTDTIRALTGRRPQSLEEFVTAHARTFGG